MRGFHRARCCLFGLAVAGSTAACYAYVPVEPSTPQPGATIRAQISEQAATQLTSTLGPGVFELHGLLLERPDDSFSVLLDSYRSNRTGLNAANEPVRVPVAGITQLEQKHLSKGRTIIMSVAFVGGAFALTQILSGNWKIFQDEEPSDPGPVQVVVPRTRVPVLRMRLR